MKVLALVIFSVAAVSGLGSGPYLPSGWRPQGPAFYLPSEVQKPVENPLKDTILQESEASGSDALREYGPPKVYEVSQDLTSQALPEAVTEQAFVVIQAKFSDGEVKEVDQVTVEEVGEVKAVEEAAQVKEVEEVSQVNVKEVAQVKEVEEVNGVTEAVDSQVTSEQKTTEAVTEAAETTAEVESEAIQEKSIETDVTAEINEATTETAQTTEVLESTEDSVAVKAEVDSNVESTQVEQVSQVQEVEERTVGVKNVAEPIENLDKEIKAQVQTSEDTVEVKAVQVIGQEAPEGFLEYGPPGFREYGPPQADDVARSAADQQSEEEQKTENNETRRRRFSPKFRSSKKQ